MEQNTNIISVIYEDNYMPKTFSGKKYTYYCNITLSVGDLVIAPTQYGDKVAKVSRINIPEDEIQEDIKPYLKEIEDKINTNAYIKNNQLLKEVA